MDWDKGFSANLFERAENETLWEERRLSQMKDMFYDQQAVHEILAQKDPVIYRFQTMGAPETAGDIAFGLSKVYPGLIGNEYYMTKGHFHSIVDTGEVYYTLSGHGLLLIENVMGDWRALPLEPGRAVYAPKGYAHRSVNTGDEPMVSFFAYRADAGHDYKTIETLGFRNWILKEEGKTAIVRNRNWEKIHMAEETTIPE